jgi:hypothetical protein
MEYTVKVNKSFKWVLDWLDIWKNENRTGEIKLVFKKGGISGMERKEWEKPSKDDV